MRRATSPDRPCKRKVAEIDNFSPEVEIRTQDVFPMYLGEFTGEATDEELQKRFQVELDDTFKSNNDCSSPLCIGGGAVYSCIEGARQCGSPKSPAPINTLPPATRCFEDADCTGNYECPGEMTLGCLEQSHLLLLKAFGVLYLFVT